MKKIYKTRPCKKCGNIFDTLNCRICNREAKKKWVEKDRPCAQCGVIFNTITCKPCHNKATKKWRDENLDHTKKYRDKWFENNKDRTKETSAAYKIANPEKLKIMARNWRVLNKEKTLTTSSIWRENNKDRCSVHRQNRRSRVRNSDGILTIGLSDRLYALQKGKCACCQKPLGKKYHLDHIVPLSKGGLNIDSNIQLLRSTCNLQKSARDPIEFMQSRGFLI